MLCSFLGGWDLRLVGMIVIERYIVVPGPWTLEFLRRRDRAICCWLYWAWTEGYHGNGIPWWNTGVCGINTVDAWYVIDCMGNGNGSSPLFLVFRQFLRDAVGRTNARFLRAVTLRDRELETYVREGDVSLVNKTNYCAFNHESHCWEFKTRYKQKMKYSEETTAEKWRALRSEIVDDDFKRILSESETSHQPKQTSIFGSMWAQIQEFAIELGNTCHDDAYQEQKWDARGNAKCENVR